MLFVGTPRFSETTEACHRWIMHDARVVEQNPETHRSCCIQVLSLLHLIMDTVVGVSYDGGGELNVPIIYHCMLINCLS